MNTRRASRTDRTAAVQGAFQAGVHRYPQQILDSHW